MSHKLPRGFSYVYDIPCNIVYATSNNFVGRPLDGYIDPVCIASDEVHAQLRVAQSAARKRGLSLYIYDAYRPLKAVDDILRWSQNDDESTKAVYYPDVNKADLFDLGYVALRSGHTRGSAVDVTLMDVRTKQLLDMGTIYDFFGPQSATLFPDLPDAVRNNRKVLVDIMASARFVNLPEEWWHYSIVPQPFPNTYFDNDVVSPKTSAC